MRIKHLSDFGVVGIVTIATLFTKLLGMIRSLLFASTFGTGMHAAAFAAATRIPIALFDLLLSAALSAGIIPVLAAKSDDPKQRDEFCDSFLTLSLLVAALLTLIGTMLSPVLMTLFTDELSEQACLLGARLLRLVFPSFLLCTAVYALVAVWHAREKHLLSAFVSLFSNGTLILFLLLSDGMDDDLRITCLAAVFTIGWLIQLLTLLFPLLKSGWRYRPRIAWQNAGLAEAMKTALPATLCAWTLPFFQLFGTARASALEMGGAAIFEYGISLYLLVCGLSVHGLISYLFPKLSHVKEENFARMARNGLVAALFLTLPTAIVCTVLAERGVCLLYLRGAFTARDASLTAALLRTMALSIPFYAAGLWLSRVCFVGGMRKEPMICAPISAFVSVGICLIADSAEMLGFALTIGQVVFAALLLFLLQRAHPELIGKAFARQLPPLFLSSLLCTSVMLLLSGLPFPMPAESGMLGNLLICLAVGIPGIGVYLLLALPCIRRSVNSGRQPPSDSPNGICP